MKLLLFHSIMWYLPMLIACQRVSDNKLPGAISPHALEKYHPAMLGTDSMSNPVIAIEHIREDTFRFEWNDPFGGMRDGKKGERSIGLGSGRLVVQGEKYLLQFDNEEVVWFDLGLKPDSTACYFSINLQYMQSEEPYCVRVAGRVWNDFLQDTLYEVKMTNLNQAPYDVTFYFGKKVGWTGITYGKDIFNMRQNRWVEGIVFLKGYCDFRTRPDVIRTLDNQLKFN